MASRLDPEQRAAFEKRRANHCRQIGILGGEATKRKYGNASGDASGYYSAIGKEGFNGLCKNHELSRAQGAKLIRLMNNPDRNVRNPHSRRFASLIEEARNASS